MNLVAVILSLAAFSATGEYDGGGQYFKTFDSVEACVKEGYNIYANSEWGMDFQINPENSNQFAILYPDGSIIAGDCKESIGI